jgi:putative ABC transport system substrate-binding protein
MNRHISTRRSLMLALSASAFTAPWAIPAQAQPKPPEKIWRVGFLSPRHVGPLDTDFFGAFPRAMRELGYIEGKNLIIEWRSAEGNLDRLPALAAELVQLKVDVIVAAAQQAVRAAQKGTTVIPIVMGSAGDPVANGFVKSLARPGGNITGTSTVPADTVTKRLQILLDIQPKVKRLAVLYFPSTDALQSLETLKRVSARTGVKPLPVEITDMRELEAAFAHMKRESAEALLIVQDAIFTQHLPRLANLAIQHKLPSVASIRQYTEAGGLMNYGVSFTDNYRMAAVYVDKIFKGAKPADLPVEQPVKFEMFINGKTAKALGLKIPPALLISADKVIE